MKLEGKIAIVTGASSGMGYAIAQLFAKEGAKVIAVARRKERLEELVASVSEDAGEIIAYAGDVSLRETNDGMIDYAIETYGKLDILINNAGVMDEFTPVGELSDELWEKIINVNLYGPMCACRKAVNVMQDGGTIVNISSIGGVQGCRAGAAYAAAKSGVIGLTKNTAYMYGDKGIRCNAIAPGGVDTEVAVGIMQASKLGMEKCTKGVGLSIRMGKASEIATATLFLACDDSSLINGTVLVADAGWTAY